MRKTSDRFYKIKEKHVIWAGVKSAVCGISSGLAVTGVLLLALKLSAITLAAGYYVLIGAGVALICGAALFILLFNPTDKQVARRTDDDYRLNERVQTALEYSGESGTLVELQREDAEERLNSLAPLKFSFARIWKFVAIAFVALAIGIAGILVPAKTVVGNGLVDFDSTPREVTELERAGVRELISNIEASSLSDELKESVGGVLEQLLTDLDGVDTEGTLAAAVNKAIDGSGTILSSTLSYIQIGGALTAAEQIYLGQAVIGGGDVYKYYMLTLYDEVRSFNAIKYDAANAKVGKGLTSLRNDLTLLLSGGLADLLGSTASGITAALTASAVSEQDGLYTVLQAFAGELLKIKENAERGSDDTDVQSKISDAFSKFGVNLTGELSAQAYNAAIKVFVSNRLKTIFGYSPLELPLIDPDKGDGNTDTPDPDNPNPDNPDRQPPGSGGSGEMEYGSDDMVWVPGRGYMKYGEIIEEYYNLINQYLHSDELTEEQKNMISAYYDILFGSNKNK